MSFDNLPEPDKDINAPVSAEAESVIENLRLAVEYDAVMPNVGFTKDPLFDKKSKPNLPHFKNKVEKVEEINIPHLIEKIVQEKCNEKGIANRARVSMVVFAEPVMKVLVVAFPLTGRSDGYRLEIDGKLDKGITDKSYMRFLINFIKEYESNPGSLDSKQVKAYKKLLADLEMQDVIPLTPEEARPIIEKVIEEVLSENNFT